VLKSHVDARTTIYDRKVDNKKLISR